MFRRVIEDRMSCVEAKAIGVVFMQPVLRIVYCEFAHPLVRIIDGISPRRVVTIREIVWCEITQIVAVWSEMVVDDVDDDAEPVRMRGVGKTSQRLGSAVNVRWGKQI